MSYFRRLLFSVLTVVVAAFSYTSYTAIAESVLLPENQFIVNKIDQYLQAEMAEANIPGLAFGIVKNDEIIMLKGYGIANRNNEPVTPQTSFILASVSKSFTALAILQLAEQGFINLDAPIASYLPTFPSEKIKHSELITVRHLLNQRSGFTEADGIKDLADRTDYSLAERFLNHKKLQLAAKPGEQFAYSNLNYTLLGWIVESVANQSLNDYFVENIFTPLQMTNSFTNYEQAKAHGLAEGYRFWFGKAIYTPTFYYANDVATGYVISSAEDMLKYLRAHIKAATLTDENSVVTQYAVSQLFNPIVSVDNSEAYGMGWYIDPERKIKYHPGDIEHFHSEMGIVNANGTDWGIVLLTNANSALLYSQVVYQIFDNIVEMIQNESYEPIVAGSESPQVLYNIIILTLIAVAILQFYVDYRIRKTRRVAKRHLLKLLIIPTIVKLGVIVILLIGLPYFVQSPLSVIVLYQPDLGYSLILISLLTVVAVIIHSIGYYLTFLRSRNKDVLNAQS